MTDAPSAPATNLAWHVTELNPARCPGKDLIRTEAGAITWHQADIISSGLARTLADLGVGYGDRVCVRLPNCAEFVLSWLAIARLGAVTVTVNTEYKDERLAALLRGADARVLVAHTAHAADLHSVLHGNTFTDVIWVGGPEPVRRTDSVHHHTWNDSVTGIQQSTTVLQPVSGHDPLIVIYTSGSTGLPKPVVISHGFARHMTEELECHVGYSGEDVFFTPYPLFHSDAALLSFAPALVLGGTFASVERFSASRFVDQVRGLGATVMTAMGSVVTILLNTRARDDDTQHGLRLAISGARPEATREFERRFGLRVVGVYGSTESCLVAFETSGRHVGGRLGQVCRHHDVVIADATGQPLPVGETGEILVRPAVPHGCMSGYLGHGEATAHAWRDLWYHTGDLGRLDRQHVLWFAGRLADRIRRRGRNLSSREIEQVLEGHDAVLESAAIGVPATIGDEEVKVVLSQRDPTTHLDPDDLASHVARNLPDYMVPRYVEVVPSFPRTPSGKIDKTRLRTHWVTDHTYDRTAARYLTPEPAAD